MKNNTTRLIATVILLTAPTAFDLVHAQTKSAQDKTLIVSYPVPNGIYVNRDRPPCRNNPGFPGPADPGWKAVEAAAPNELKPIVMFVARANGFILEQGGDIAKWFRGVTDQNFASCLSQCTVLPKGATPTQLLFSDRRGIEGQNCMITPRDGHRSFGFGDKDCGDYSEWREATVQQLPGSRYAVCAVAANWSHDRDSNHKLWIRYRFTKASPQDIIQQASSIDGLPPELRKRVQEAKPPLVQKNL